MLGGGRRQPGCSLAAAATAVLHGAPAGRARPGARGNRRALSRGRARARPPGLRLQPVARDGGERGAVQHGGHQPALAGARDPGRPRVHLQLRHLLLRHHPVGVPDLARALVGLRALAGRGHGHRVAPAARHRQPGALGHAAVRGHPGLPGPHADLLGAGAPPTHPPLPGSPLPQPAPGSSRPATSFLSPLCGRARRWHGTACRPRQGPRPGAQPPCKQRRRKHARRLAHAAPGAAQEATQRPTFGEIIPVLRRLLAEETRRQARRPSAGAAAAASEAAPRALAPSAAAGGSGDLAGARGPQVPASLRAPACPMCRLHFHAGTWPGAHARYQRVRRLPRRSGSGPIGASTSGGSVWLRQPWACASAVPVAVMRPLASRPQLRRREWSVCIVPRR